MDNLEFRQIVEIDDENLDRMTKWMYDWWGESDGYTFDAVKCYLRHSMQKDRLPQTYGLFSDRKIIAMCQFVYEDLVVRPDIYPWLANVYVDVEYRSLGLARIMLEKISEVAKETTCFDELYLYTKHIDFYEKFGWVYVSELDTYTKSPRMQRLYRLELKNNKN